MHEHFEAGTVSFLDIMSVKYGLEALKKVGMAAVARHTASLTRWLHAKLASLRHSNGNSVCNIYGNHDTDDYSAKQGPILTFNIFTHEGRFVQLSEFQDKAAPFNIHIRTGCMCNPGACHSALGIAAEALVDAVDVAVAEAAAAASTCKALEAVGDTPLGAIRVSVGYPASFDDVFAFYRFVKETFVR
eukprot:TRINITY_DN23614_c0_g1_i1.p1 TRINITY_DN23614_c0_g1~~TRINITY_DN23614_c0_g1_i1.p1  ORF type:complete len:188 (-),score=62.02 TRINITY_DN23614_c0_g1_i1:76-639(-)